MPNRHYWTCDPHSPRGIIRYHLIRVKENDPDMFAKKYFFGRKDNFMILINPKDVRDSETIIFQSNSGAIAIKNGQTPHTELQKVIPVYRTYIERSNLPEELRSALVSLLDKTEEKLRSEYANNRN